MSLIIKSILLGALIGAIGSEKPWWVVALGGAISGVILCL